MARGQVEIGELVKLVKGVPKRGVVKPAHPYIEKSRPPKKAKTKT
jgi:hypothetical protein